MTMTDEQLDALAERLRKAWLFERYDFRDVAREAARWAAEQQGEVVWEVWEAAEDRWSEVPADRAALLERKGYEVRAIRVIATTTKEQ